VVCTDHTSFNYQAMVQNFPVVVDTRNALKGIQADNIFRL
jgi:UDP-N-acetyl-D-mannosaminuronate dehydrogenase